MKAVVLAGSAENELTVQEKVNNKSFIKLGEKTVIGYVLDALTQVKDITEILVVGPPKDLEKLQEFYSFTIVPEEGSITDNIYAPYKAGLLKGYFLLVTGDIPLLTVKCVEDFISQCRPYTFDFYYSIIAKEVSEEKYPSIKRTYVPLKEGTFTGGNIFLGRAEILKETLPRAEALIDLRKSPVKIIMKLGVPFLIKFFLKSLTIKDLVKRLEDILGIEGKAVITEYPEIGTDLDKSRDLAFFREQLGG